MSVMTGGFEIIMFWTSVAIHMNYIGNYLCIDSGCAVSTSLDIITNPPIRDGSVGDSVDSKIVSFYINNSIMGYGKSCVVSFKCVRV